MNKSKFFKKIAVFFMAIALSGMAMAVDCTSTTCSWVTGTVSYLVVDYGNGMQNVWGSLPGVRASGPTTPVLSVVMGGDLQYGPDSSYGGCDTYNFFSMPYSNSDSGQSKATYSMLLTAKAAMMKVQVGFSTVDNCEIVSVNLVE